jgi:hypothetical protein
MNTANRFRIVTVAGLLLPFCFAGCGGGGGYGESVSVPQTRRQSITGSLSAGSVLTFPADAEFNVTEAQRHSTGNGQAESFAKPGGMASCHAATDGKGTASAEFQLGQVVYNSTADPVDADVVFDCDYEYAMGADASSIYPKMIGLKLYIQNSNNVVLKRAPLVSNDSALGASRQVGRQSPSFHVTMEPGLAYRLVLAGRVEVEAEDSAQKVDARVNVKSLRIEVHAR